MSVRLIADYPSPEQFIEAMDLEVQHGGLLVRNAPDIAGETECVVEIRIAGELVAEVEGQLGAGVRRSVSVFFDDVPFALIAHADRLRAQLNTAPSEETAAPSDETAATSAPRGTIFERISVLTIAQRIQLGLSGDREARLALLRDHNKILHAYVLRNPRIGIDEVLFAAKLNTLSPDALKAISEHQEWGQNIQVFTALVRNPKTPLPVAIRYLPRLSSTDLRAIGKGGARDQIVHAARKLLSAGG